MRAPGSKSVPAWAWPVVLVTAIHLLTTSGGWWVTDHGEVLTVANRFISTGRLDLDSLDPEWADWARITQARGNTSTRFQPLSILALTPFLALDRVLGWGDRSSLTFVHLQGHAFVTLGLVLVAHAVARRTGSAAVVALSVLLAGLNWPVWMIARRLGPEPVLFALLAAFAAGGRRARFWSLFLLPWVHASGPILGLGALLGLGVVERSLSKDAVRSAGIGWTAGIASVAFFWNLPVHGHILLGGYGEYSQDPFFTLRNPLVGLLTVLGPMILWTLPLWGIAAQAGRRGLEETLALWLPATAFLSVFSNPEPERRLAPLLGAWTVALLTRATPGGPRESVSLAGLGLVSGVLGLSSDFVDTVPTPIGVFSGPLLMFVRLAFVKGQPGPAAGAVFVLATTIVLAGSRTVAQLLGRNEGRLGETGSLAQNLKS